MPRTLTLLLLSACPAPPLDPAKSVTAGDGLFLNGCPVPGESLARSLTEVAEAPWGEESLAGPGDVMLANAQAAFVIQGVDDPDTYYQYGGAPIDAVTVEGCEQTGPERFEEMGFIVGQLDLLDFNASTLHQIRGREIEIVADGSDGGPAIVEVYGTDDRFWLVELTLVRNTFNDGGRKELGELYGLDITLRYTLDPDAAALQMDVLLDGEPIVDGFLVGAIVFPTDLDEVHAFATGQLSLGGFQLDLGVPWLGISGLEGSFSVAMPEANMGYTSIAGVRALVDVNQAMAPVSVTDAAEPIVTPFVLSVGATDGASATSALEPYLPAPLPDLDASWGIVAGAVTDGGLDVVNADVLVYAQDLDGNWAIIDRLATDPGGEFSGRTVAPQAGWQLVATAPGRDQSPAVAAQPGQRTTLTVGPAGSLAIHVVDTDNLAIPARVELERADGVVVVHAAVPNDTLPLPPGTWTAWVSRGYEYNVVETTVTVPSGGAATLTVTLDHLVDTLGWASVDTHVHAEASADSDTLATDRMRTAAAAGLDVVVSTDHEAIIDISSAIADADLSGWLAYGLGSEVTATVPEHVNAWPFPLQGDARGNPVRWYQFGFPELYAAIRGRGARVVQLNHSRVNGECGILCVLDWDRQSDTPATDDPEALGLPPGTEVWSWDFDTFELLNGLRSPLLNPDDSRHTGALVDWLAFHNLGHRVTAVGVTDVHGLESPGMPRTYVRVPDDSIGVLTADHVADGELDGAAIVSAGAFARVDIDGAEPGDTVTASGFATLSLIVTAIPEIDLSRVVVLSNCDSVADFPATDPHGLTKYAGELDLPVVGDAYVVVLGFGAEAMPRGLEDYDATSVPRFVSNPIFVDGDGDGSWTAPGAKPCATGLDLP